MAVEFQRSLATEALDRDSAHLRTARSLIVTICKSYALSTPPLPHHPHSLPPPLQKFIDASVGLQSISVTSRWYFDHILSRFPSPAGSHYCNGLVCLCSECFSNPPVLLGRYAAGRLQWLLCQFICLFMPAYQSSQTIPLPLFITDSLRL